MLKKFISGVLILQLGFLNAPVLVLAEDPPPANQTVEEPAPAPAPPPASPTPPEPASPTPPTPPTPTPPTPPTPPADPDAPVGAPPDYAYNEATNKWEPTIISSFEWNRTTHIWESPFYWINSVGWYVVKPGVTPSDSINALTSGSGDPAATMAQILGYNDPANINTGPNSTNSATYDSNNSLLANLMNSATVNNNNTQSSTSGDANIMGNTTGGNALTGAATVVTNLLNLLNSMWTWSSGGFSYFVNNVWGAQHGDINLNIPTPSGGGGMAGGCGNSLNTNQNTGPSSTNTAATSCNSDITVNSATNATINNNVDMTATSGNATVSGNTHGGNATSGNAVAELNIVNLINTAIGAGQTFFGLFNIYGDLNGDILFPGLSLNGALASQSGPTIVSNDTTGPNSTNNASASNSNSFTLNDNSTATINNNINATATSGNAGVTGNTHGGSATTGSATTDSSIFNLFNSSVFGDNAVLVLINDMGRWVGRIMNLGGGAMSGLMTSGAVVSNYNTGPNSTNNASYSTDNDLTINNNNTSTINNNVNIGAHSGDATVSGNTHGGNATSGNASVATNVANIVGSNLSFKKVFGILMINIFGSWTGSVGVDTEAGESGPPVSSASVPQSQFAAAAAAGSSSSSQQASGGTGTNSNRQSVIVSAKGGSGTSVVAGATKTERRSQAAANTRKTSLLFLATAFALLLSAMFFSVEKKFRKAVR